MTTSTVQNSPESKKGKTSKKPVTRRAQTRTSFKGKRNIADGITTKLYRQGREAVSSAYDSATRAGARASRVLPDLTGDFQLRSRGQSFYTMMEERPIVMGAVGLGVGMVLAALLPSFSNHRQKH